MLHSTEKNLIRRDRRAILLWLIACALLVAAMVLIGGYTRLSGSGLSITSWKPIHGVLPPLDAAAWQEEFRAYQASPQYIKVNTGMTLPEFQAIFWPEFIHRLLGRAIGLLFLPPLLLFAARRSLSARFGWRLAGIFALGGLQGGIGWLMVKSGLVDDPNVSAVRLALHLSLALLILGLLLWAVMDVAASGKWQVASKKIDPLLITYHLPLTTFTLWFTALCLQILLGAFMAGLHAGWMYNTWPDMNGEFMPYDDMFSGQHWYENRAIIQFLHRNLAVLVALGFVFWWYCHWEYVKNAHLGKVCALVLALIAAQFALGVATLLHQAPLNLALAHQMGALGLFSVSVVLLYKTTRHPSA